MGLGVQRSVVVIRPGTGKWCSRPVGAPGADESLGTLRDRPVVVLSDW